MRFLFALGFLSLRAIAADQWIEYRMGPFHVFSNAGDKQARERLTQVEQLRYVLATMLGKKELEPIWPIHLVLFQNTKEYGPYALPKPLVDGGSATLGAWTADVALPRDALQALTRLLLEDNPGQIPDPIETALGDLFSTINVSGTKVTLGAPLPKNELPPDRMRTWAKIQMLATSPDYGGTFRVYLNNLHQGGDEGVAVRNAFNTTVAKLEERVDAYVRAGNFAAAPMIGEAFSPNRDFIEKPVPASVMDPLLAELKSAGKSFPPDSPRGLVAKNTRAALELAAKANPRWGEPHYRLAALEANSVAKIAELKLATKLEPRNLGYWQALAEAQIEANQYADADKSWSAAEHAARTEADRARIRQVREDFVERRAEFEAAEKRRIADEQAHELQRIKDAAAAEVHAAEQAANARLGGFKSDKAPEPWWDNPQGEKVAGKLARVDCLKGPLRLTIQIDGGGTIRLLIRDPQKIVVQGKGEALFGCGVQRPVRKIRVVYNVKADAKLDIVGEVAMVEFP